MMVLNFHPNAARKEVIINGTDTKIIVTFIDKDRNDVTVTIPLMLWKSLTDTLIGQDLWET